MICTHLHAHRQILQELRNMAKRIKRKLRNFILTVETIDVLDVSKFIFYKIILKTNIYVDTFIEIRTLKKSVSLSLINVTITTHLILSNSDTNCFIIILLP